MIDWINAELPAGCLDSCPALIFKDSIDIKTGELDDWREAQHGPFTVRVHNRTRRTELRGSLHKYWSRSHNGGTFHRWEVGQAVEQLAAELDFEPAQAQLHGLEWGANVPMPAQAKGLLRRAVLHSTKPMDIREWGGRGCLREATGQQFFFKLYDKEAQLTDTGYDAPGPLLRVELKARKMKFLRKAGVKTLADLSKPAALKVMGELLLAHLGKVMFAPPGQLPQTLTRPQRQLLREGASSTYWTERPRPQPRLRVELKQYRKLTAQHVVDAALDAATQGLQSIWQQLLAQPAPLRMLATAPAPAPAQITHLSRVLPPPFQERETAPAPYPAEGLLHHPAAAGLDARERENLTQNPPTRPAGPHCCLTCGRPLTNPAPTAKFCSERELGTTAKKCRNAASNPRNNARRRLLRDERQGLLFDVRPFVRGPQEVREFMLAA